ncbi:hypothetical protein AKJ44_01545 [candidate division MSBL1 archaeon SCGC-AAA261F17]|uniref:Uncharacterized protein n=1 Tax=candidate division MSBL1 archaeon SCGC-AAA261F17 TaxID=1698274 RepID=A0A133V6H3_9EURY|nr:hypothetical protein AKJ44_01545 [candidate division MSBL1 archaeon SCGC-AAA261F17]
MEEERKLPRPHPSPYFYWMKYSKFVKGGFTQFRNPLMDKDTGFSENPVEIQDGLDFEWGNLLF